MDYSNNRKAHLCRYAEKNTKLNGKMGGHHQNGEKEYAHIIKIKSCIDKDDQYNKIKLFNILPDVCPDMLPKEKLHPMAHYLTSSQIVCYNFFRPLLDKSGHPTNRLIALLKSKGIVITKSAIGEFEYNANDHGIDGRLEHTEFDFHLLDETLGTEVFFEIKYTETDFGKWKKYATSDNFNNFYRDMFSTCYALKKEIPDFDVFCNYFQLYRNSLRVKRSNQYSIFIFPYKNEAVKKEFDEFSESITRKQNVFSISWEELTADSKESEFYNKYFSD